MAVEDRDLARRARVRDRQLAARVDVADAAPRRSRRRPPRRGARRAATAAQCSCSAARCRTAGRRRARARPACPSRRRRGRAPPARPGGRARRGRGSRRSCSRRSGPALSPITRTATSASRGERDRLVEARRASSPFTSQPARERARARRAARAARRARSAPRRRPPLDADPPRRARARTGPRRSASTSAATRRGPGRRSRRSRLPRLVGARADHGDRADVRRERQRAVVPQEHEALARDRARERALRRRVSLAAAASGVDVRLLEEPELELRPQHAAHRRRRSSPRSTRPGVDASRSGCAVAVGARELDVHARRSSACAAASCGVDGEPVVVGELPDREVVGDDAARRSPTRRAGASVRSSRSAAHGTPSTSL